MNNKKLLLALLVFGSTGSLLAQVHNKGILKVSDNAVLYTKGVYNFGVGTGKTSTSRTATTNGLVSLSAAATAGNVSPTTNFVDGFVKLNPAGTLPAFYKSPVGSGTIYGPIGFNATNTEQIVNAFVRGNTSDVSSNLEVTKVDGISAVEYWKVASSNVAKVTLFYSSTSAIPTLLGSRQLQYLTILGFTGTQWVAIDSQVTAGSLTTAGSVTSNANVALSGFTHFAIGLRKDLSCYNPVVYNGDQNIKTWNGSWTPNEPTINDKVIINAPLTITTPIECYAVEMNSNIIMEAGTKLTVANGFTGSGKIIMSNLASVIQQNPVASEAPAPKIQMTRIVENIRRYDYVFISNPINDISSFFSQVLSKDNAAVENSDGTVTYGAKANSAFDNLRTYNAEGTAAVAATSTNTPIGRGLSSAVRNQSPYSSTINIVDGVGDWANQYNNIHLKIEGIANTGSFTLDETSPGGFTRLGNPYLAPLSVLTFWDTNPGATQETAYYWTYNTARANLLGTSYTNADFATFNRSGGVKAGSDLSGNPFLPDGFILPMQSILIRPAGKVTISPCQLQASITPPNPPVSSSDTANGKFRLNLTGSANTFSQILVSYDSKNGTLAYDNGYDSSRLIGLGSELSTLIDDARYTIQTRPAFTIEDVLPLKMDKRTDETFTINLATSEGVFTSTSILLHDKTLGIYHDLSVNGYSFIQSSADDTQRFEVVYQNSTLNNSDFDVKNAFAFITKNQFRAQSNSTIAEIAIYDITGRLVITYSGINQQGFSSNFDNAQGVYIAKIKLTDGTIVNQKVIQQ